jgi:tRNA dimethylallyltransferase
MNLLVAIVGLTAVGKSAVAIRLAQGFDGEIVSADSRHVYRYMDIGTAKPSTEERALRPLCLGDIARLQDPSGAPGRRTEA